jgi:hypothetical protein
MTEQQYYHSKTRIESEVPGANVEPEMYGAEWAAVANSPLVSPAPRQILHTVQDVEDYLNRFRRRA